MKKEKFRYLKKKNTVKIANKLILKKKNIHPIHSNKIKNNQGIFHIVEFDDHNWL